MAETLAKNVETNPNPTLQERIEKNKKLAKEYPFIIPRNIWTDEYEEDDDYDYSYTELDFIPEGWRKAYGILICEDIKRILGEKANDFRFHEIKEKLGQLQMHYSAVPKELNEQFDKYKYLTGHTCIQCGKIGVSMTDTGAILPLCEECYEEKEKDNVERGYEEEYRPYHEVILSRSGQFELITRTTVFSSGEKYIRELDCTDILKRVDQNLLSPEIKEMLARNE